MVDSQLADRDRRRATSSDTGTRGKLADTTAEERERIRLEYERLVRQLDKTKEPAEALTTSRKDSKR